MLNFTCESHQHSCIFTAKYLNFSNNFYGGGVPVGCTIVGRKKAFSGLGF